ncbi:MAG: hypothetical protein P1U32_01205 [Legionellaceae bacterium]|nr:hypothetical protein [Legionellaceae bacterium]
MLLERFKKWFDLKLDESEEVELRKVDDELAHISYEFPASISALHQYVGSERRKGVARFYQLKQETSGVLKIALASGGNEARWKRAYDAAQASDAVARALLVSKLRDMLVKPGGFFTPGSHTNKFSAACFALVLSNWSLKALTSIDEEILNQWSNGALYLFITVFLLPAALNEYKESYLNTLLPFLSKHQDLSEEVKRLALEAGVEVGALEGNTPTSQLEVITGATEEWPARYERATKALMSLSRFSRKQENRPEGDNTSELKAENMTHTVKF